MMLRQAELGSELPLASDWQLLEMLFWLPLILLLFVVVHEVGHLVVAYLVGAVPTEISIGGGEPRRIIEVGSLDVTIRRKLLGGGHVAFGSVQSNQYHWRTAAILLAGVGAEIVFWLIVFLPLLSFENVSVEQPAPSLAASQSLVALAVCAWHVVACLVPSDTASTPNDGRLLLQLTRSEPPEAYLSRDLHIENHQIQRSIRAGHFGEMLELVERRLERGVEDQVSGPAGSEWGQLLMLSQHKGYALLQLGRYPDAVHVMQQRRSFFEELVPPDMYGASEKWAKELALLGNSLAYGLALEGIQLERALELAEAAVESAGGVDYAEAVLGTLGAVLVQVGREGEGIDILNKTLHIAPTDLDKFETHRFLAIGYRAERDVEAAIGHCEQALAICPDFAERIEPILAGLTGDGGRSLPGALKG